VIRLAVSVEGAVQGVGFRPFVHALATGQGLVGWVQNGTEGVRIEVQGPAGRVQAFLSSLRCEAPPASRIEQVNATEIPIRDETAFRIAPSRSDARVRATVPADLATCAECLAEVQSPAERRYRYPFTNCTGCGPRYTILLRLPYDRANTTLGDFPLCEACAREYADPRNRRFHAQPIACPACGPRPRLLRADGTELGHGDAAMELAAAALVEGRILALKGLGGFQLLVDATDAAAVGRLRERKQREEKPFAVLFPSLEMARAACVLDAEEEALLSSPAAPIVLVRRRRDAPLSIAAEVAPRNPYLGVMLPCTPLHSILLSAVQRPVVCTSGNLSEEPMCIDNAEAMERLGGIADVFLVHDRPIVRPLDDSVTRIGPTGPQVLRRARGYTPLPHPFLVGPTVLALGGQLKSTVTWAKDGQAVVSQHLGDLFSPEGVMLLERTVRDLGTFFDAAPEVVACDLHPDYASTRLAERLASEWCVPIERVQHHHAHVAACVAEHRLQGPVLGLAWDGAGFGTDDTLWGGEALVVDGMAFERIAHLRPFSLPGGERAIREPRRAALGLIFEVFGASAAEMLTAMFTAAERSVLQGMLERGLQSPRTTSMGRLFDAVAALAGVRHRAGFEGQAAMELEFAADGVDDRTAYPLPLRDGHPALADWEPLLRAVLFDVEHGLGPAVISARFHNALVELADATAQRAGISQVVLSGGCFQNLRLANAIYHRLVGRGFKVFLAERFPTNDGGVSLGQAYVAALRRKEGRCASVSPVK
jgi:hydrogenase maturation protein HypF